MIFFSNNKYLFKQVDDIFLTDIPTGPVDVERQPNPGHRVPPRAPPVPAVGGTSWRRHLPPADAASCAQPACRGGCRDCRERCRQVPRHGTADGHRR